MKRPRCPKCNFGNTEKLGEMVHHVPKPNGNWQSTVCNIFWTCPKCDHSWSQEGSIKRKRK